ncbi:MAG: DUF3843 family protein [Ignavibacteriaceae bacterium]|nr:DUF3843 family protein [Ignavibacterium sp.]MCC6256277.1 DUF3843 family protein [Ignavibacteriaceae bacterium]HMN24041.1 DUF3843 family protein [Ignavibacteriaceae bacterium]HRN26555.1 DUF3843 family protein [Ignavibacteriaceae bacterium]HRP91822.1 DUF3843 family protein [Ignavibacteriaceae bacterium]
MDKRIYIKDWLDIKPYVQQTKTDSYYLRICNDVKRAITSNKQSLVLQKYLGKKNIDHLSCFLTSYLEDLVSGTNIWNTFVKMHKRLYKKQLPFYILDEYTEEEINQQDVRFLIWYFINTVQEENFIAPFNDFIVELSEKVSDVFVKAWVYAPKNEYLKSFYQIDEDEKDFYVARNLINTILFNTYLFYPDTLLKLKVLDIETLEDRKSDDNIMVFLNENRDSTLHNIHTRLLSLKGKEWAAEILGNDHLLSKSFFSLTQRIRGFFLYKGQDDYNIFIEHIASGKKFELTKKSFDQSASLSTVDTIIFMGIVKWKDEWWFSGVYFQQPFHSDLILDEKNSLESRMAVNFLDHHKKEIEDHLNKQLKAFKDFNNGSQIAFLSSEKINDFYRGYMDFFNNSLNLSAKEIEEAKLRARKDGFFSKEKELKDLSNVSDTGLVFYNPKTGVEIALGVNSAFPLPNNPFYNAEKSDDDIMSLLLSDEMSTELALFCIDNCKKDLPFFSEGVGKMYLKDIDFLLRFWKKENYYAIPSITFVGKKES